MVMKVICDDGNSDININQGNTSNNNDIINAVNCEIYKQSQDLLALK